MYAKLGEVQVKLGLEPTGFMQADTHLAEQTEEYMDNPLAQACFTGVIEDVVRAKLRAGYILSARQTIVNVPWNDWREDIIEPNLIEDFKAAEAIK